MAYGPSDNGVESTNDWLMEQPLEADFSLDRIVVW